MVRGFWRRRVRALAVKEEEEVFVRRCCWRWRGWEGVGGRARVNVCCCRACPQPCALEMGAVDLRRRSRLKGRMGAVEMHLVAF